MSILQKIQKWSTDLPTWQQDAIARLYVKSKLEAKDLDDLYALLKAEHGIPDPKKRVAISLSIDQVAAPQDPGQVVQLTEIRDLRYVNAIAENQSLPLNPTGLTIIYGDNGVGKSGYSRVLKKACRARDQREPILPNANYERGKAGPAQATFKLLVDGIESDVGWTDGQPAPTQLSSIALFDAHCARAYIDNDGDFAYVPYGLDILERLAVVCNQLREMARVELAGIKPNIQVFDELAKTPTKVGSLLSKLSINTKFAEVEALGNFEAPLATRLDELNRALAEADPKQKAQVLRLRARRFHDLAERINVASARVDDQQAKTLRGLVEKSNNAKAAAALALELRSAGKNYLPETGGDAWRELFKAARAYATLSHPGKVFPHLGPEDSCPLCQNPLGEHGSARFLAFEEFIQQEAERSAQAARQAAADAYQAINQADLDLRLDPALKGELEAWVPDVAYGCVLMQEALIARRDHLKLACVGKAAWDPLPAFPANPVEALSKAESDSLSEAKSLDDSTNAAARAALIAERSELEAQRRLSELKQAVVEAIQKLQLGAKIKASADATGTTAISRKSTELARDMATVEVAAALNQELDALSVDRLKVVMKNASSGGKNHFKLALELPGGTSPAAILSEGEQRAIAVASFLAEVNLCQGTGGIVFDDPVSSLDHVRRELVANRLAQEALSRQVIVFTHDLYFTNVLHQSAIDVGLFPMCQNLRRTPLGNGVAEPSLPFGAATTKDRVGMLRQIYVRSEKCRRDGDDTGFQLATRDAYAHLRMAWERAVEELLFNGTVVRFRKGVETQRLSKVFVETSDVKTIQANMSKCSAHTGHDGAMVAQVSLPDPAELIKDIQALEDWRLVIVNRKKEKKHS